MKKLPPLPTAWFATVALAAAARGRGRLLSAASTAPAGFMTVVCAGSAYGSIASRRLGAPTPPADAADGQLAALPASPNCVGTADTRPDAALRSLALLPEPFIEGQARRRQVSHTPILSIPRSS